MKQVVVVELFVEGEDSLDLGDVVELLAGSKQFKRADDGDWSVAETGDQMQWFDESDDCEDDESDHVEHDHTHIEDAVVFGAIIFGKEKNRSASLLIQWFLDNAEKLKLEPSQFNLTTYFAEID